MLQSQRILLRSINKSDISCCLKWFNDPEVIQYLSLYLPINEIMESKWIEEISIIRKEKDIVFVIELHQDKRPIGTCGIHRIDYKNQHGEIGMVIGEKELWGKGYGNEASRLLINYCFSELNFIRISTGVFSFNKRSLEHFKKLGFQIEGIQRKFVYKRGEYHDNILLGLLKDEWLLNK